MFVTGTPVCLSFVTDSYSAVSSRKITYGFPINDSEMDSRGKKRCYCTLVSFSYYCEIQMKIARMLHVGYFLCAKVVF